MLDRLHAMTRPESWLSPVFFLFCCFFNGSVIFVYQINEWNQDTTKQLEFTYYLQINQSQIEQCSEPETNR